MQYSPALALAELEELQAALHTPTRTAADDVLLYTSLQSLLVRLCLAETRGSHVDFSSLFSRLYALCRARGIDHRRPDRARRLLRRILHEARRPSVEERAQLFADLRWFIEALKSPQTQTEATPAQPTAQQAESLRAIVESVLPQEGTFIAHSAEGHTLRVVPTSPEIIPLLAEGNAVMLLDVRPIAETECENGTSVQAEVVLEPDFLIDVTALCACMPSYGPSPYLFLLNKLTARESTAPILLGEIANLFMEECLNAAEDTDPETLYSTSLRKAFEQNALAFCALSDEEVNAEFFQRARQQFEHIYNKVHTDFASDAIGVRRGEAVLEAQFLSPWLGLRGRMDVVSLDLHSIIELKSGKSDEWFGRPAKPRREHVMQMSLYREMLRRAGHAAWESVRPFLFYSRYPLFFDERPSAEALRKTLLLRNQIVYLERLLARGKFCDIVARLTPERLNTAGTDGRLWREYQRPPLAELLQTLQEMPPLEREYFTAFFTFIEREQFLAKTCDNRPDSGRGFSRTWTASLPEKLSTGDILTGLTLVRVEGADGGAEVLHFQWEAPADFVPNFSPGETVMLYAHESESDTVATKQVFRAFIEHFEDTTLQLRLAFRQRCERLFPIGGRFAVEHDYMDVTFSHAYRGLYALLTAPASRRALLLGQRPPEGEYALLVGPPGAGKTNVSMRAMVLEHAEQSLLLMAYTNRAVDEICQMLEGIEGLDYIRIGAVQTCAEAHRPHLFSERVKSSCRSRGDVRQLLTSVHIIVGTVVTMSAQLDLFRLRSFDLAIIDEASQLLEPQLLTLLCARDASGQECAIRRFQMIGDHKQLPAVVCLPAEQTRVESEMLQGIGFTDLRNSLFERLHRLCRLRGWHDAVHELDRQGRMHADIAAFPAQAFYEGRLLPVGLPHQQAELPFLFPQTPTEQVLATRRIAFFDVPYNNIRRAATPRTSPDEAEKVAEILESLLALSQRAQIPLDLAKEVGIIVPFRAQIGAIRAALRLHDALAPFAEALTIDTVECYQGSTRNYIIFSATISHAYQLPLLSEPVPVGGIEVDRKLNVALTRARLGCYIVGCGDVLRESKIYNELIAWITK